MAQPDSHRPPEKRGECRLVGRTGNAFALVDDRGWPSAEQIDQLQWAALRAAPGERSISAGLSGLNDLFRMIEANHAWNRLLWAQEDQARRTEAPDAKIAGNKRAIDRYNQRRNDAVEAMDEWLLSAGMPMRDDGWLNSETAGSIVDRLSINALKIHHMARQVERSEAGAQHVERCRAKLAVMRRQREDLLDCLQRLLNGLRDGSCGYRLYRQFKMYNDPSLNPCLYEARRG